MPIFVGFNLFLPLFPLGLSPLAERPQNRQIQQKKRATENVNSEQ